MNYLKINTDLQNHLQAEVIQLSIFMKVEVNSSCEKSTPSLPTRCRAIYFKSRVQHYHDYYLTVHPPKFPLSLRTLHTKIFMIPCSSFGYYFMGHAYHWWLVGVTLRVLPNFGRWRGPTNCLFARKRTLKPYPPLSPHNVLIQIFQQIKLLLTT